MTGAEKVTVVIVDDIAETRENVHKLLQFEPDVEVVGSARNGREGIELARELKPDVILMDINMPDIDGITATETIRRDNTITQIVILSVQADPNYMRRAMLAGARDFLTKPPAMDELTAAIRRAGKMAHDEREKAVPAIPLNGNGHGGMPQALTTGKIIVVYSPKGGSGCTMVSVNLAMTLHNEETQTVIVDGNLQFGDVAVFLNEQGKNSVADLAPRSDELDPEIVEEVLVVHAPSGAHLLAAPSRPEHAEDITGEQFANILQYLARLYSYVIVDTSSTLTDATLSAIEVADLIILITTQEIPSIKDSRLFLDLMDILKIDPKRFLLIMNRYDKRIGISPEKVGDSFKREIATVLPLEERVVVPSINRGVPFMLGDRSRPIARGFISLAEAVRQSISDLAKAEAEPELPVLGRFGKR